MPIDTQHPEYIENLPIWQECKTTLKGQPAVRAAGTLFLPKTSGMEFGGYNGDKIYNSYRNRARFFDVPSESLEGAMGVLFAKDPLGELDEIVTVDGRTLYELSREVARQVYAFGRVALVVEAPEGNGGRTYIAMYAAETLINWVTDRNGKLKTAVFVENKESADQYKQYSEGVRYRAYLEGGLVLVADDDSQQSYQITAPEIPVVIIGSVDCSPSCDPPPVRRIAECAIAAYQISADYRQSLYLTASPTPWVADVNQETYDQIVNAGIGTGALWHLGEDGGKVGYLEFQGASAGALKQAIEDELSKAAEYAVRLTQTTGVESAAAKSIRDTAQKSALSMMADSISIGINRALRIKEKWGGEKEREPFQIRIQESGKAEATMITALNGAANSQNIPRSILYEYLRQAGLEERTNDKLELELNQGVVS